MLDGVTNIGIVIDIVAASSLPSDAETPPVFRLFAEIERSTEGPRDLIRISCCKAAKSLLATARIKDGWYLYASFSLSLTFFGIIFGRSGSEKIYRRDSY